MMATSRLLLGGFVLAVLLNLSDGGLVKKILRHRRQSLMAPGADNITLPNPHQPVVFNHVYNINVPAGSLCSVDLESPGGTELEPKDDPTGTRITEHTLDGENQIVFTHRINIPKQACGCSDGLPDLKNLLSRLEVLEGEVSTLREQCTSEGGCCGAQATGNVGMTPYCGGHGNFSSEVCGCICEPGWKGPNCSESECPDDCSDQGRCVDGKCQCFEGYGGHNCSLEICPVDCGKYGQCIGGVCVCTDGYFGKDCSQSDCLNNCLGRGQCVDGDCVCEEPWTGFDCSELICPNDCYDRGRCNNGTCECDEGFTGEDCGQRTCPNDCMGRGFCVDGQCVCSAGYTGEDCSSLTCLNDCSGRGQCFNGVCICEMGYQGEDCSQLACLNNCNNRGQCINGRCQCDAGFQGEDCSELSCPNDCRNRGRCVNGQCVCDEGFTGEDCNVKTCPSDCFGRGTCVDGKCVCHAGFTGEDCSELSCPNDCQNRGRCVSGQCVCDEGFTGEDCSLKACPNDCLGRGYCDDGRCVCQEGFAGDDCSVLTCPANCNNRGRCINGACQCEPGFEGDDCGQRSCLNNCNGVGRCVDGQCVCDEGYIGEDCSEVSPPKDLIVTDVNTESVNLTWFNEMLVTEYLVTYVPTAPGGLLLERTVPGDRTAATIDDLEPGIEYLIKVFAVLNNKKSVPVSARVATHLPQPDGLKFKSIRDTSVEVFWDQLDIPFEGWELSFRNTKEENGKISNMLNRGQTSFEQVGLGPGQEYEVSLGVLKNNTSGPQTTQTLVTKLDTPRQTEVRDVTDTYAVISWSPPVAQIDAITLSYGPSSDPYNRKSVDLPPTDTQHTTDGLSPDTEYEVTLVSKRGDMTSDPASETFTTGLDAPIDLQVVGQTDNTVTLEWTNSQADVDRYRVKFSPVSGTAHGEDLFPEGSGDKTQATITGLKPGTEYGIGVTAVKNERESLPATVNAVTDLDPPRDLEVKETTETTMTVTWKRPRAKIGNYRLVVDSVVDGRRDEVEVPGDATTYTLTGRTPGTRYTITLVAERGRKRSDPVSTTASTATFTFYLAESGPELSAPSSADDNIISFLPIDTPDLTQVSGQGPEDETGTLTVSDVTSDGFDLSWESKADVLYDSYTVELTDVSGLWDSREIHLAGDAAGSRIRGLNASTEYQVRLYGVINSQRSSPFEAVAVTAPKSASPDVVALRFKSAPTSQLPPETGVTPASVSMTLLTTEASMTQAGPTQGFTTTAVVMSTEMAVPTKGVILTEMAVPTKGVMLTEMAVPTDQVMLTERAVPTNQVMPTERAVPTNQVMPTERPVPTERPSGAGPEGSGLVPPGDVSVTNVTQTSLALTWSAPEATFDSFRIKLAPTTPTAVTQVKLVPSSTRSANIDGLLPGTQYEVSVNGMVEGEQTQPILVLANTTKEELKPQVGNLMVSDVSWESFNVSWTIETGEFEGFVIEVVNLEGGPERQNLTLSGDALSLFMSGLSPSSTYGVSLYGLHKGSLLGPVYTEATTVKAPVVGNLYVSNVTHKSFSISWNGTERGFEGFILEVIDTSWQKEPVEVNISQNTMWHDITGLEPSTDYIAYLYGVMRGRRTHAISTVATTAKPPDLYGLVVSNITSDRLSLSWKTGEKAFDNFIVEVRESALPSQAMGRTVPGGARSTIFNGLKGNTRYNIKLYGSAGRKNSPALTTVARTEAKAKLGRLSVSKITPHNFTLVWKTVAGHFDGFVIRVSDREMLYDPQELTPPGNTRKLIVSGLVDTTAYDVQMYGLSHGRRTPPVSTRTRTASLPKVENLTVSDITPYGFRVSWATRDGDRSAGKRFSHFQVEVSDSGRLLELQEFSVPGNQTSLDISGLITGIGYEIRLTGVSASGLRSRTLTAVAVTEAEPEIEHLFVSDVTPESFRIAWTVEDGVFDRFVIKVRDAKKLAHPHEFNVAGDERTKVMTDLMGGTEYEIELYGVTLEHRSQPLTAVARTGLGAPRGIRFSDITATSSMVHWTVPRANVDSYRVTFVPLQDGTPETVTTDGTLSETLLPNLIPGETYRVTVVAVKGLEESDPITDTLTTSLDMPRSLTAVNITDTEALLLWQPAIATVDGYVITYSADTVSPVTERVSGNIVEFEMSSLSPDTKYTVSVYATKDALKSQVATTEFTTELDAPRDLVASNVLTDSAMLTWTPPRAAISNYILTFEGSDGTIREVVLDASETSYSAADLSSSTEYVIRLQAVSGVKRSRHISTTFTTAGVLYRYPKDCSQALLNGESQSGLYTIYVGGNEDQPMQVYCDMATDGGGWVVFLRRQSGKTEFFRNWRNYSNGFGDMMDEFWLGLSNLHKLTTSGQYELRVDLRDGSESVYAYYDKIVVGEPRSRYKIQIGSYSGTAGDSMTYHQNRPFSTYDNDNDVAVTNCALSYKGAFWYKNCHRVNLMGKYGDNSHSKGINWFHWKGHEHSVPFAEMKIRPLNFGNLEGRRKRS